MKSCNEALENVTDLPQSLPLEKEPVNARVIGVAAAFISAITFGSIGVFAKLLTAEGFSLAAGLSWRFFIASIMLWCLKIIFERRAGQVLPWPERFKNMLFGALGYGLASGLFFYSMEKTTTGLANILLFQNPLVVFLLTWRFRRLRPTNTHILVMLTSLVGLVLILWPQEEMRLDLWGVLAGLASAVWYGGYLFLTEDRSKNMPSITLTFDVVAGTMIGFSLFCLLKGDFQWPVTSAAWYAILGQASLATVVPVLTLVLAMRYIGARETTLISALEPVVTVALGVALLGETWSEMQLLGSVFLISGVALLNLPIASIRKRRELAKARRKII